MEDIIEIKLNFKEKVICFFGFIVGSIFLLIRYIKMRILDKRIRKDILK